MCIVSLTDTRPGEGPSDPIAFLWLLGGIFSRPESHFGGAAKVSSIVRDDVIIVVDDSLNGILVDEDYYEDLN